MTTIRTMIDEPTIHRRVQELGREIRAHYGEQSVHAVCVLKGSLIFFADLVRAIGGDVSFDYIAVSSYGAGVTSSGQVRFDADLSASIEGRHVLIIEDIVDTGRTMAALLEVLASRRPASVAVATLLDKPSRRVVEVPVRFTGFAIEDEFVVGYGLDFDQRYRALPFIGVVES